MNENKLIKIGASVVVVIALLACGLICVYGWAGVEILKKVLGG